MAKFVVTQPVITFAGSTVTQSCASVTINLEADDVETTSFGTSGWRTRIDRKSTRLNSSHIQKSRMPSSA